MTTYELVDGCIEARYSHDGAVVTLKARDLRRTNTGPHAFLSIVVNGKGIAYDVCNIHRLSAKADLTRTALKRLGDKERAALGTKLPLIMDEFCLDLWDFHLQHAIVFHPAGSDTEPQAPAFWLPPYVMHGGGTIIFAPPGGGKSYLTMLMAVSIDAGCSVIWPNTFQGKVVFVNLERSPISVDRRIYRINRVLGLPGNRRLDMVHARGRSLSDICDSVKEACEREACDVIFLDSISRTGAGKLVEDQTANSVIDMLNSLAPTWVAIGHTPRADATHVYGNVMWDAGEDIGVQMLSQRLTNGTLGVGLQVTKANDMAFPPLSILAFEFDSVGLTAVRQGKASEFPSLTMSKRVDVGQEVYELLLDAGKMTATELAKETGHNRQHLVELLRNDPRFQRLGQEGHSVYYGAKRTNE